MTDTRSTIDIRLADAGLPPLPRSAWLEIDLAALAANLATLRGVAGRDVRVEPVVKADAYGHGSVPVALALEEAGADGFSVAALDEALELRAAGVGRPILVLYPVPPDGVAEAARRGIAVTTNGGPGLDRLLEASNAAVAAGLPPLDIQLEVETGLGRGGAMPDAIGPAAAAIHAAPGARLTGCWSHLAATDPVTARTQDMRFATLLDVVASDVLPANGRDQRSEGSEGTNAATLRRHLAASGAILGAGTRPWDAVRPGLSVYGIVPDGMHVPDALQAAAASLRPVMSLHARPVRVVDLPEGHGVSYGPTFVTRRRSRIVTLPVGYGDGWRRGYSDRTSALVRGVRVPIVGRVAMDAIMVDVTDVPGPGVTEEDEFLLLGGEGPDAITAAELARIVDTIPYEVTTAMAHRLPRVYHRAGTPTGLRTLTTWAPARTGARADPSRSQAPTPRLG